ncbi:unnamed protein product [Adineta steineri]|uniref:Uncharacterized protein n=1 Tax=Adineta steineri TaxID=433720 RepID=A0A819M5Y7_9BILA|nr:unnamed protein product [Adineta steineri]CAF3974460.1 unnamed protein product [Adineta steineri]
MDRRRAIGIDLGTAYSCVAIFQHDKVEVIPNELFERTTPSYVTFTKYRRLVGSDAKYQADANPNGTIFNVKRLIGRRYDDAVVQNNLKHWPFQLVIDLEKPKIMIEYKEQLKLMTPEEVSALILRKMKQIAEDHLGGPVTDAVITVPAAFTDSQRQATKDAAVIAGLNVLRILSEPVAAAMAYGLHNQISGLRQILIFDLGGGTTNVSVIVIYKGVLDVKSTSGDVQIGGEDFHIRMATYFIEKFKREHNIDLSKNKHAKQRLRSACEQAKKTLSSSTQASINIDLFHENIDFKSTITRTQFEKINDDLFVSMRTIIETTLRDAKMDKSSIDDVVLIGGSSRIPKIRDLIRDFFNGKLLNQSINPDEAVAYGAAIQAAILSGNQSEQLERILSLDVAPYSLGIEAKDGQITTIIERNTTIPTKQSRTFEVSPSYQADKIVTELIEHDERRPKLPMTPFLNQKCDVDIKVFEGQDGLAINNNLLGCFTLSDILFSSDVAPQIEITFDIDANGILNVSAIDKTSQKENKMRVTNDKGRLSESDIESLIKKLERYDLENN